MARLYRRSSKKPVDDSVPDALEFLLNGERVEIERVDPSLTVLDYLRNQAGLTGTRAGCVEGGCGACTVCVGELQGARLVYQPVNSCITLLASLYGKHLVTIEGVKINGKLHPAQQALVSAHASRCGFCTPGVVMTLYSLCQQSGGDHSRNGINDALSGNLCRCTGYRSIVVATGKLLKRKKLADYGFDSRAISVQLKKIGKASRKTFKHNNKAYHAPVSPDELAALVQEYPKAILVAGATDVGASITKRDKIPQRIISLECVSALKQIRTGKDMVTLGAGVTLAEAREVLGAEYPDLGGLIRRFGSPQIRNRATLAGNIAQGGPYNDLPPALIALDAGITLRVGHFRRHVQLQDFYQRSGRPGLKTGEFIESIQLPRSNTFSHYHVYKLSKRHDQDRLTLCGAFYVMLDNENRVGKIRICYAGMGPGPARATKTEQALVSQPWILSSVRQAVLNLENDFTPDTDHRGSSEYRLLAAGNLLARFFLESGPDAVQTRIGEAFNE